MTCFWNNSETESSVSFVSHKAFCHRGCKLDLLSLTIKTRICALPFLFPNYTRRMAFYRSALFRNNALSVASVGSYVVPDQLAAANQLPIGSHSC